MITYSGECCPTLVTNLTGLLPFQIISAGDFVRAEIRPYGDTLWTTVNLTITSIVTEGFYIHSFAGGATDYSLLCGVYEFRVIAGETWWFEPFLVDDFTIATNTFTIRDDIMTPLRFSEQAVDGVPLIAPCDSFLPFMFRTSHASAAPTYFLVDADGTETALTITVDVSVIDGYTYYIHDGACFYPFLTCGTYRLKIVDGANTYYSVPFVPECGISDIPDGYQPMRDFNGCVMRDTDGDILIEECSEIPELFTFILESTGTGLGVSTLIMEATEDVTLTLDGTARFYSDAAATLNESTTWNLLAGALRTIYIRCPSGTSNMVLSDASKLKGIGGPGLYDTGWRSTTSAANIIFAPAGLTSLIDLRIFGNAVMNGSLPDTLETILASGNTLYWSYTGAVPSGLTLLAVGGINVNWIYNGALPSGLTFLSLGDGCYWTYTGALPIRLTSLQFQCVNTNSVAWTYNGALPVDLTYLYLQSTNINWTYNGALPAGLTDVVLLSIGGGWVYNGIFPVGVTRIYLDSESLDWSGLDIGDTGNITTLWMDNHRQVKITSADMITLLTQLTNRTGTLPAVIVIGDYADYAAPPPDVVTAVNTLKATKGVFSVDLRD